MIRKSQLLFTNLAILVMSVSGDVVGHQTVCNGVPDGYFVRDTTDCQGYYYCRNGIGTYNRCPGDYYYNELSQMCDFPDRVMCHICLQQTGVQILPHPQNCNQFITCAEGKSYLGECIEGHAFDRWMMVCNPVARVNCGNNRCPVEDDPTVVVYLPGLNRCDEYFICRAGSPIQRFCAPGLYWDAMNERCDLSEHVNCALP
ncbi:peritrophin-1-like [Anopheles nili]|uniref:peritrophin-1-like n=1 Tax=Anopheles nili TaxID=185578 RepID=UPI00237A47CA|nr:peritrophin-1-like [Anopheles nili]